MYSAGWRLWNTLAYIATVLVLLLANNLPLGGRTTGEIAAMFSAYGWPAAYAFSIWGLIYVLLGAFVLLQWRPGWQDMSVFRRIGPWFIVSCFFHIAWVLCWHYQYFRSSVFLMAGLLLTLVHLYRLTRRVENSPRDDAGLTALLFVQLPFSLSAAWASVMTAANALIGLEIAGPAGRGTGGVLLAVVAIVAVAVISLLVFARHRDTAWLLAVIWALIAVGIRQQATAPAVAWVSWLLVAALALVVLRIVRLPHLRYAGR